MTGEPAELARARDALSAIPADLPRDDWVRVGMRVDTRKWLLSKLLPKKFGDKIEQQITGKDGAPLSSPTFNIAFVTPPAPVDGAT